MYRLTCNVLNRSFSAGDSDATVKIIRPIKGYMKKTTEAIREESDEGASIANLLAGLKTHGDGSITCPNPTCKKRCYFHQLNHSLLTIDGYFPICSLISDELARFWLSDCFEEASCPVCKTVITVDSLHIARLRRLIDNIFHSGEAFWICSNSDCQVMNMKTSIMCTICSSLRARKKNYCFACSSQVESEGETCLDCKKKMFTTSLEPPITLACEGSDIIKPTKIGRSRSAGMRSPVELSPKKYVALSEAISTTPKRAISDPATEEEKESAVAQLSLEAIELEGLWRIVWSMEHFMESHNELDGDESTSTFSTHKRQKTSKFSIPEDSPDSSWYM